MGVSADIFEKAQAQLQDAPAPEPVKPAANAESGWTLLGAREGQERTPASMLKTGVGYVTGTLRTPTTKPVGSIDKSLTEIAAAGAKGFATGADFLKGSLAGWFMPLIPEGDKPGAQFFRDVLRPSEDTLSPQTKKAATEPETVVGKVINPAAEGVGAIATMPIPGAGLARNVIAGMGMGEGAEIGKHIFGGILGYFDPAWKKPGEATGQILGGAAGAQLNVSRMAAAGEILRTPIDMIKNTVPAYKSARAAQEAGDQRKLWEIFADEYGNLRAQTRGIISDYTNAELASAIRRDIRARTNAQQFDEDVKTAGMTESVVMKDQTGKEVVVRPWGLGERTMVPAITRLVKERVPKTFAEGVEMDAGAKARQSWIVQAYNKIAGAKPPGTEEGAQAAALAFQRLTQAKVDALAAEQGAVQSAFTRLDQSGQFQIGEKARGIRDARAAASYADAAGRYERAFQAAGEERIPMGDTLADAKAILKEFYVKIDPRETLSPVIADLVGALKKEQKATSGLILPADLAAERAAEAAKDVVKDLTLREANDLVKALGNAASNAKSSEQFAKFARANELQKTVLDAIAKSKLSPEAKGLFDEARTFWATEHAPRFMEGAGKALGKERGGVMEGREAIKSEEVMGKFLADKETGLRDFDRIYGNDPQAGRLLNATLENEFRNRVLKGAKTPDAVEKAWGTFKDEFSPALLRFPQTAEKMEAASARTMQLQEEQAREIARYKDIMGGPVTQAIGPVQAKVMYERALADPLKMEALLRSMPAGKGDAAQKMVKELFLQANPIKNGEYDAQALTNLLMAGKSNPAMQSSMDKLFEAAYGKEGGKKFMDTLEAIAGFTLREAATNPRNLRPGSLLSESPVKEASGQSMASWISAWRAQEMGATGSSYFSVLGLSRFANAKAQAAVENAKLKALYDPDTAKAVLEMAATPSTQPLGLSTAKKVFGDIRLPNGQKLIDRLIDRGYVKRYLSRGAIYGAEQAESE